MSNWDTHIIDDYLEAIFNRAEKPMEPLGFMPNVRDRPSQYKIYQQVERICLPDVLPQRLITLDQAQAHFAQPPKPLRALSFEDVSALLWLSHGAIGRRLGVTWNRHNRNIGRYERALHQRSYPSGGGMYPAEIYWASGPRGSLLPGLYHYDNSHHALERLYTGDPTPLIRKALLGAPAASKTDQFLLISLNFWKNSWKYNSFCYHVVTHDVGSLFGSLRFLALGMGSDLQLIQWFHDEVLNQAIGLETLSEGVFGVIPLPFEAANGLELSKAMMNGGQIPRVDRPSFQRSQTVIRFEAVEAAHQGALVTNEQRPGLDDICRAFIETPTANGRSLALPPSSPQAMEVGLLQAFVERCSSFGRLSHLPPLSLSDLATILRFSAASRHYATDLKPTEQAGHFTRIMLFANHVEGLPRGGYAYNATHQSLIPVQQGDFSRFLQRNYFLDNYNVQETAVVLVIVGRPAPLLQACGNRGLRVLNAEAGYMAQSIHIAAAALGIGCGAILGFNNAAFNHMLGLDGSDHKSMLILFLGHEREGNANVNGPLIF